MSLVRIFSLFLCVLIHTPLYASASNDSEADLMEAFVAHVQGAPALDLFTLEKQHGLHAEDQPFYLTDKAPSWDMVPCVSDVETYLGQVPQVCAWLKATLACFTQDQINNPDLRKALFALMVNARAWPVTLATLAPSQDTLVHEVLSLASTSGSASLVQAMPFVMHPDDFVVAKAQDLDVVSTSTGRSRISLSQLSALFPMQRTLYLHHATYAYPYLDWREHYGLCHYYATRTRSELTDIRARDFAISWEEVLQALKTPLGSALGESLCAKDASFKMDTWTGDGADATPHWRPLPVPKKLAPGVYNDIYYAQTFLPLMEERPLAEWAAPPKRDVTLTTSQAMLMKPHVTHTVTNKHHKKNGKCALQ